jgi:hypothetical protein
VSVVNGIVDGRIMMAKTLLLLAAAGALPLGGAAAQEEVGRPFMRDGNGNVVRRGGLALDENGDFVLRSTWAFDASGNVVRDENGNAVFLALDPAGDFEAAARAAESAGLVLSPAGKWVAPTPESALRAFRRDESRRFNGRRPVVSVLTRRFDDWPRAELDALADELVRIVLAEVPPGGRSPSSPIWGEAAEAESALYASGRRRYEHPFGELGVPYEGAFDALLRIWEASYGDAPVGRRWDPMGALESLYFLEPEGRGRELLHAEVAAAEVPTVGTEQYTPWCDMVRPMYSRHNPPEHVRRQGKRAVVGYRLRLLDEELRGLPGNAEVFKKICGADQIIVS